MSDACRIEVANGFGKVHLSLNSVQHSYYAVKRGVRWTGQPWPDDQEPDDPPISEGYTGSIGALPVKPSGVVDDTWDYPSPTGGWSNFGASPTQSFIQGIGPAFYSGDSTQFISLDAPSRLGDTWKGLWRFRVGPVANEMALSVVHYSQQVYAARFNYWQHVPVDGVTLQVWFRNQDDVDAVVGSISSDVTSVAQIGGGFSTSDAGIEHGWQITRLADSGQWQLAIGNGFVNVATVSLLSDTWYNAEWSQVGLAAEVRLWSDADGYPSAATVSGTENAITGMPPFAWTSTYAVIQPSDATVDSEFVEWDRVRVWSSVQSSGTPYDMDEIPTKVDGVYRTQYPYEEGTLRVYSNETEIFDFVETDHLLGYFTINAASDVGTITCTYTVLGQDNPQGGDPGGTFRWPCQGYVTQEFGCTGFFLEPPRGSCAHFHDGIDIANRSGTPLVSPADGTINYIGWNPWDTSDPAFIVVIDHAGGYQSGMAHLLPNAVVSIGQVVSRGELVGHMGSTGNSTGPHCHWEIYVGDTPIDPRSLM